MAFSSFFDLFKSDGWGEELSEQIEQMLELAGEMFAYAVGVIVYEEKDDESQVEIYDRDQQINRLEREIRRRIVTRMSVTSNRMDVVPALVFMNAVKDVERIGDYLKNLYEVTQILPENPDRARVQELLVGRSRTIEDLLARTARVFVRNDEAEARDVIDRARKLAHQAEEGIGTIARSDWPTAEAVPLVMALRFFKRIAAHLANLATSVVMPIDKLDFYDER